MSHLEMRNALANTLVIIVTTAILYNFALMHREQDFDEEIEDEGVPFDIAAAGKPIPMLVHWCISFHSFSFRTFIFSLCSSLTMDKNGSSMGVSDLLRLYL